MITEVSRIAYVEIVFRKNNLFIRFFPVSQVTVERLYPVPIRQHSERQHAVNDPGFALSKSMFGSINVPKQVITEFRVGNGLLNNDRGNVDLTCLLAKIGSFELFSFRLVRSSFPITKIPRPSAALLSFEKVLYRTDLKDR
ncbi:MAG: hypothetical protein ACKVT2_03690 [Saprospiraceae bacterium]